MRRAGLIGIGILVLGGLAAGRETTAPPLVTDDTPQLGPKPATVTLEPDEETRRALEAITAGGRPAASSPVRLLVGGLKPTPTTWARGGRVFLNLSPEDLEAPEKLTPAHLSYIGSFSLYPIDGDDGREQGFYFALAPVLQRLAKKEKLDDLARLRITILGIPRTNPVTGRQEDTIPMDEVKLVEVPNPARR
jgi:hypothetical protein